MFQPAARKQAKGRICLDGPSGSGKTWGALAIAQQLGSKIACIDSENGSAELYAPDPYQFDTVRLTSHRPQRYTELILEAEKAGYDVCVIDSLSHAWMGVDGALAMKDQLAEQTGNSFAAWAKINPPFNTMLQTILRSPMHIIATMRTKTAYLVETDNRGKAVPRKIGLAPQMREGIEYEFDVVADVDLQHNIVISKTRCRAIDGVVFPGNPAEMGEILRDWLAGGEPVKAADEAVVARIASLLTEVYGENGRREKAHKALLDAYNVARVEDLTPEAAADAVSKLEKTLARETGEAA